MGLFSVAQDRSVQSALVGEIAAARAQARSIWLDIDAIKPEGLRSGGHVYKLLLSKPTHLSAEQTLTFHLPGDHRIEAVVISSSDEGLVVICQQPLPENAVVLKVEFDPSFIIAKLREFLQTKSAVFCPLAERLLARSMEQPAMRAAGPNPVDLNLDQRHALANMEADPIHFLWGPPGTGKTTTLGAAIVRWMSQGKSVLVVSTSNVAVDVAMASVLKRTNHNSQVARKLLRLGKSDHPDVSRLTRNDSSIARVVGCTLAKMVIDPALRTRTFDVVVVDETSMVALLYALAAATMATERLVYGGDFMQLPPICQSNGEDSKQWFGSNIYDWLGIDLRANLASFPITLLRTQYRMTDQIGGLVSHLCYQDQLVHGRGVIGGKVDFVEVPEEWRDSFYSVEESSYYHPFSIPIIHSVVDACDGGESTEFLLLTPFRPQQSLLGALAFDLRERFAAHRFASSTIHRAQGGERRVVILDLTAQSPTQLARFFRIGHSERLLNVGLSRARDTLVIIGSEQMVRALAQTNPFWTRLLNKWRDMQVYPAADILNLPQPFAALRTMLATRRTGGFTSICSYRGDDVPLAERGALLTAVAASRKLLVLPTKEPVAGGFIVREDGDAPQLIIGQGHTCLPLNGGWVATYSPNASRVIWRVGFKHLADEEVKPTVAEKVFQCPRCTPGKLVLDIRGGEQRLTCNNAQFRCFYNRRLGLNEAVMKVQLAGMRCDAGHPMTARHGRDVLLFMGCENWPDCTAPPKPLSLINGM